MTCVLSGCAYAACAGLTTQLPCSGAGSTQLAYHIHMPHMCCTPSPSAACQSAGNGLPFTPACSAHGRCARDSLHVCGRAETKQLPSTLSMPLLCWQACCCICSCDPSRIVSIGSQCQPDTALHIKHAPGGQALHGFAADAAHPGYHAGSMNQSGCAADPKSCKCMCSLPGQVAPCRSLPQHQLGCGHVCGLDPVTAQQGHACHCSFHI